ASAAGSDFNLDFAVFTEEERGTGAGFNFGTPKHASEIDLRRDELHGLSAFALEDGIVYHTYSCYDRGTDALSATWQLLDRTPKGAAATPTIGRADTTNTNDRKERHEPSPDRLRGGVASSAGRA